MLGPLKTILLLMLLIMLSLLLVNGLIVTTPILKEYVFLFFFFFFFSSSFPLLPPFSSPSFFFSFFFFFFFFFFKGVNKVLALDVYARFALFQELEKSGLVVEGGRVMNVLASCGQLPGNPTLESSKEVLNQGKDVCYFFFSPSIFSPFLHFLHFSSLLSSLFLDFILLHSPSFSLIIPPPLPRTSTKVASLAS